MASEGRQIWLDALRSGDYEQGKQELGDAKTGFCCLGLACKLAVDAGVIDDYDPCRGGLSVYKRVQTWVGLHGTLGGYKTKTGSLAGDNDRGISFAGIADIIETGVADA